MTGVLLVNLGSPDSPSVKDVRKYLTQFLSDRFVIDINPVARFFLVNFFIVPFRAPKSARLYQKIWTPKGSPLIVHSKRQKELLQEVLNTNPPAPPLQGGNTTSPLPPSKGDKYIVELGIRYGKPSIESAFRKLVEQKVESIIAIPLYPQWASSSTQSSVMEIKRAAKKFRFTNVKIIEKFYDDERYIDALVSVAEKYRGEKWDFFIFSYHGLPERQIIKSKKEKVKSEKCFVVENCCTPLTEENQFCYRAACYHTTRQLVKRLNISEGKYITSFQSRLSDNWLKPFTDKVIVEKAKQGAKKILVFSPSFVADCLETLYEIGTEYSELFRKHGGEKLQLVESLNENEKWIECLRKMVGIPEFIV